MARARAADAELARKRLAAGDTIMQAVRRTGVSEGVVRRLAARSIADDMIAARRAEATAEKAAKKSRPQRAAEMRRAGKKVGEISRALGCAASSVHRWLRLAEDGSAPKAQARRPWSAREKQRLCREYAEAAKAGGVRALAASIGRSYPKVLQKAVELGLTDPTLRGRWDRKAKQAEGAA